MTKWEYNVWSFVDMDTAKLESALADAGKEGWELVLTEKFPAIGQERGEDGKTTDVPITVYTWIFKRPQVLVKTLDHFVR